MRQTAVGEATRVFVRLSEEALDAARRASTGVELRSALAWGEHCTECVMPSCYATCSLYTPRRDLKCRRFADGMERVRFEGAEDLDGMRLQFRKWGKLEAQGRLRLFANAWARRLERAEGLGATLADLRLFPFRLKDFLVRGINLAKARLIDRLGLEAQPDAFLIACFNESDAGAAMTFTVKPTSPNGRYFQRHFRLEPKSNRIEIPFDAIRAAVDPREELLFQIEPVGSAEQRLLTFTFADFVVFDRAREAGAAPSGDERDAEPVKAPAATPKCKCVVWDLDNTLWSGILVEDGLANLRLRPAAARAIEELDRRGVLHSIASKNNAEEALAALERFGVAKYFLAPQIGWGPKSAAISRIAEKLNIGKDSLAFIDDQPFERAEVASVHAEVRVLSEEAVETLLDMPAFDVPVTQESRQRREMYREAEVRDAAYDQAGVGFLEFLRMCNLRLRISDLDARNCERVCELCQRTNQLNYSGRRLTRTDLVELVSGESDRAGFVLSSSDRFGDYGVIGFAVLDLNRFTVEHFFMSCRVQHKKVDHAFFGWLLARVRQQGADGLHVVFRSTGRNAPSLQVLTEMKFKEAEAGVFASPDVEALPDQDVVAVNDETHRSFKRSRPALVECCNAGRG